jgi:hypothetical protein
MEMVMKVIKIAGIGNLFSMQTSQEKERGKSYYWKVHLPEELVTAETRAYSALMVYRVTITSRCIVTVPLHTYIQFSLA